MTETRTYTIARGTGPTRVYHAHGGGWTPIRPMSRRWIDEAQAVEYLRRSGIGEARVVTIKTTSRPRGDGLTGAATVAEQVAR